MDALHALGYPDAHVVPCTVEALNRAALEYEQAAYRLDHEDQLALAERYRTERNAHVVVIGASNDPDQAGGWSGHLVVVVGRWLLDLTLNQATRPEKALLLEPLIVELDRKGPSWTRTGGLIASVRNEITGVVVRWYSTPQNWRYLGSTAASPDIRSAIVRPLVDAIRSAPWLSSTTT
jgi:hypothetical protein